MSANELITELNGLEVNEQVSILYAGVYTIIRKLDNSRVSLNTIRCGESGSDMVNVNSSGIVTSISCDTTPAEEYLADLVEYLDVDFDDVVFAQDIPSATYIGIPIGWVEI